MKARTAISHLSGKQSKYQHSDVRARQNYSPSLSPTSVLGKASFPQNHTRATVIASDHCDDLSEYDLPVDASWLELGCEVRVGGICGGRLEVGSMAWDWVHPCSALGRPPTRRLKSTALLINSFIDAHRIGCCPSSRGRLPVAITCLTMRHHLHCCPLSSVSRADGHSHDWVCMRVVVAQNGCPPSLNFPRRRWIMETIDRTSQNNMRKA